MRRSRLRAADRPGLNSNGGWRYGLVDPENAASVLWVAYLGDTPLPTATVELVEQLDRATYAAGDVD